MPETTQGKQGEKWAEDRLLGNRRGKEEELMKINGCSKKDKYLKDKAAEMTIFGTGAMKMVGEGI